MCRRPVFEHRRNELYTEIRDAENKYKAALVARKNARKEVQVRLRKLDELRARFDELYTIEIALDSSDSVPEKSPIDEATSRRVSEVITSCLLRTGTSLTLNQISEFIPDVKRNTISATLYNMKQRGDLVHNETTGRYALAETVARRHFMSEAPAKDPVQKAK